MVYTRSPGSNHRHCYRIHFQGRYRRIVYRLGFPEGLFSAPGNPVRSWGRYVSRLSYSRYSATIWQALLLRDHASRVTHWGHCGIRHPETSELARTNCGSHIERRFGRGFTNSVLICLLTCFIAIRDTTRKRVCRAHQHGLQSYCSQNQFKRTSMRVLFKISIPVEAGNAAAKDGFKAIQSILEQQKPEAAYFLPENGKRTGLLVINLQDASEIAGIAEPWFLALDAAIQATPVMIPADLQEAGAAIAQAVKTYGK